MTNHLSDAASPYLQLHAHQAIEWWPWSDEAWAEARRRDVPVFVSLGYAACHWCHVMSEECFDDADIAAQLNEGFVAIKVDREEHPDVDAAFMAATQALTGHGGWPASVFCTPDGQPFLAGTYFPREARDGLPGFGDVLTAATGAWQTRRDEVAASAADIAAQLATVAPAPCEKLPLMELREQLASEFDAIHGGWGSAPRFPMPMLLDAMLVLGEPGELERTQHTLEAMARGGIHDRLGGGFHRYTVDAAWVVPHFEKMLHDNALLLGSYTRAWRRTPDHDHWKRSLFRDAAAGIVGWLEREMLTGSGGFAASLDADSADIRGLAHEGIHYAWNPELLVDALGAEDAAWAQEVFHVTATGTFEHGLSTLLLHGHPDAERLEDVKVRLLAARSERFAPARDHKVVTAWNGWLIDSLVTAGMVWAEPHWLDLATGAAEALWRDHWDGTRLLRTTIEGQPGPDGVCEDYAATALGWARLGVAIGNPTWVQRAATVLAAAEELFAAPDGGWFDGVERPHLYDRPRDVADTATPSATSTMAAALHLVGAALGDDALVERSRRGIRTQWSFCAEHPQHAGWTLREALIDDDARRGLGRAVAVVCTDGDDRDLLTAAWRMAPDGTTILTATPDTDWGQWTAGRGLADDDSAQVFVCRSSTCLAPVGAADELRTALWTRM